MSTRKPFQWDKGYISSRRSGANRGHIVIYEAAKQGIDVGPDKYAVVCDTHKTICGTTSVPKARILMAYPEFCEECMKVLGTKEEKG